jgi:hypothetical protein
MNDAIAPEVATTFAWAARNRTGQNGLATSADRFIAALQR